MRLIITYTIQVAASSATVNRGVTGRGSSSWALGSNNASGAGGSAEGNNNPPPALHPLDADVGEDSWAAGMNGTFSGISSGCLPLPFFCGGGGTRRSKKSSERSISQRNANNHDNNGNNENHNNDASGNKSGKGSSGRQVPRPNSPPPSSDEVCLVNTRRCQYFSTSYYLAIITGPTCGRESGCGRIVLVLERPCEGQSTGAEQQRRWSLQCRCRCPGERCLWQSGRSPELGQQ